MTQTQSVLTFSAVGNEVYFRGLSGQLPDFPLSYDELERRAKAVMSPEAFAYVAGGAGAEHTMAANREAFTRYSVVPRMLREISTRDLTTSVLGKTLPTPLMTAPVGVLEIVAPNPEIQVATAAAKVGVTSILSTAASTPLEQVAAAVSDDASRWFQLYWPRDPELAESFVRRAEAAGYGAIVVTLDTWCLGWRPRDLTLAHLPFLLGKGIANYTSDPVFRKKLSAPPESSPEALRQAALVWAGLFGNPALSWRDIAKLREWTTLPILLKGVCHPDDARMALDAGCAGLVVSNHGGRQVDRARAALDCLPGVVAAVGERMTILFDSGIRSGGDVMIALGLGADAVLVGRPFVYGLAVAGSDGVTHALRWILGELDATLALAGFRSVAEAKNALR